jgi:hypothetical protein
MVFISLTVPWVVLMYWLIFQRSGVPDAQTPPLPVMVYEEPQQPALLTQAYLYLRGKCTNTRWFPHPICTKPHTLHDVRQYTIQILSSFSYLNGKRARKIAFWWYPIFMGKQAKKKAPTTSSAGGRGDKPRKKYPKVFDAIKRRLVTQKD